MDNLESKNLHYFQSMLHMRKIKFLGELGRTLWTSLMGDRMKKQVYK